MRKWILLLVVLVIAGLAVPYGTGIMAQKRFYSFVQQLDASNPKLNLTVNSYTRGWFKSTADVALVLSLDKKVKVIRPLTQTTLPIPGSDTKIQTHTLKTKLEEVILHGPILIGEHGVNFGMALVSSKLNLAKGAEKEFNTSFTKASQVPEAHSTILFKYFGKVIAKIGVPNFKLIMKDKKGTVEWQGLTSHWTLNRNLDHVDGNIKFGGLTVESEKANVQVGPASFHSQTYEGYKNVWLGNATVVFPAIKVFTNKKPVFFTGGFKLITDSSVDDQLISQTIELDMKKLAVGGGIYGPASLSLELKNIDAEAMSELVEQVKALNNAKLQKSELKLMSLGLLSVLPKLLDKGPSVELKSLTLQMPDGLITAKGLVNMKKADGKASNPISGLIQRLSMHFNVQIPVPLAKRLLAVNAYKRIVKQQHAQHLTAKQKALKTLAATGAKPDAQPTPAQIAAHSDQALKSPVEMVKAAHAKAEQQLQEWVTQGLIKQEGQLYQLKLEFKQGKLTVNGKPHRSTNGVFSN